MFDKCRPLEEEDPRVEKEFEFIPKAFHLSKLAYVSPVKY